MKSFDSDVVNKSSVQYGLADYILGYRKLFFRDRDDSLIGIFDVDVLKSLPSDNNSYALYANYINGVGVVIIHTVKFIVSRKNSNWITFEGMPCPPVTYCEITSTGTSMSFDANIGYIYGMK